MIQHPFHAFRHKLTYMKHSAILIAMLANFTFAANPETHHLPENEPTKCQEYKSLYYQYLVNGMYEDARVFWLKAYSNCEGKHGRDSVFYNNGIILYRKLLDKIPAETDENLKEREFLLDSISWLYQEFSQAVHHPQIKLAHARFLMRHERSCEEQRLYFKSIHELRETASASYIQWCFKSFLICDYNAASPEEKNEKRQEGMVLFFQLLTYTNDALRMPERTLDEREKYQKAKDFLLKYSLMLVDDCTRLIPLVERHMNQLDESQKGAMTADMVNFFAKVDCVENEYFLKLQKELLEYQPSALSYFRVGASYAKNKEPEQAISFFEKGLEMTKNDSMTHEINYRLALLHYEQGSYKKAFQIAETIGGDHKVQALLLCGQIIGVLSNQCGNTTFERKANYWLANDYVSRAYELDRSINPNLYLDRAPSMEEIFKNNHQKGEVIEIKCWGASTVIR